MLTDEDVILESVEYALNDCWINESTCKSEWRRQLEKFCVILSWAIGREQDGC